jgi:hypothetical protein
MGQNCLGLHCNNLFLCNKLDNNRYPVILLAKGKTDTHRTSIFTST